MAVPYQNLEEQFADVLRLASRRLEALERPASRTAAEERGARELEARLERRMRRRCEATVDAGGAAPLEYLFRVFQLTDFERHCVYLALAPELDGSMGARYAALAPESGRLPGVELCLRTFPAPPERRSALLGEWRTRRELLALLFRFGPSGAEDRSDLAAGLKLESRVLDFLLNDQSLDGTLEGRMELFWPDGKTLPPLVTQKETLDRMQAYAAAVPAGTKLLFHLRGETGSGRRTLARHLCRAREQVLLTADLGQLENERWWDNLRAVCREVILRHAALALTGLEPFLHPEAAGEAREDEAPAAARREDRLPYLRQMLQRAAEATDLLFVCSEAPWPPELAGVPWERLEVPLERPDTAQRIALWQNALLSLPGGEDIDVGALAAKFALQPAQIAAAAEEAGRLARWEGSAAIGSAGLHRACRDQLSHRLGRMASRVNAAYTWDDLILPPEQKRRLQDACAQVEYRHRVYDQWGFGKKVAYGRGLSMLFNGPPGTGKTMAAQVIANRLQLELYKVDLSGVLSKYIGETEKQLGAVFDEVKKSQSILFFDEADALFGKRAETKDAQDRYANVQTSYLLQKIEEYDGIVILASNFLQNFDEAFKRRIKHIIDFTLPDRDRREQIWRSVLPPELPRGEDLDFDFLARSFELSGSSIKNIAVSAAFLAAEEGAPLGMVHLLTAAQTEQNKTGKNLGREELGEYYHQVQTYGKSRLDRREPYAGRKL